MIFIDFGHLAQWIFIPHTLDNKCLIEDWVYKFSQYYQTKQATNVHLVSFEMHYLNQV